MRNTPLSPFALTAPSRPTPMGPLKALVLPTDFSPAAEGVLPVALTIAERTGAVVHLVHVLAPGAGSAMLWREQQAQARLDSTRMLYHHALLGRALMQTAVLAPGEAPGPLADYVKQEEAGLVLRSSQQAGEGKAPYPVLFVPPGNPSTLRRLVSAGAPSELAALLGQVLGLPVVMPEGDGAHDFHTDALLIC